MAAGPTPTQVRTARRRIVQTMAYKVAKRLNADFVYRRGGSAVITVRAEHAIVIETHLSRASNGEAAMWAVASSPRGALTGPPWMGDENSATVDNIVARLA